VLSTKLCILCERNFESEGKWLGRNRGEILYHVFVSWHCTTKVTEFERRPQELEDHSGTLKVGREGNCFAGQGNIPGLTNARSSIILVQTIKKKALRSMQKKANAVESRREETNGLVRARTEEGGASDASAM
jgi:hypothetical protein